MSFKREGHQLFSIVWLTCSWVSLLTVWYVDITQGAVKPFRRRLYVAVRFHGAKNIKWSENKRNKSRSEVLRQTGPRPSPLHAPLKSPSSVRPAFVSSPALKCVRVVLLFHYKGSDASIILSMCAAELEIIWSLHLFLSFILCYLVRLLKCIIARITCHTSFERGLRNVSFVVVVSSVFQAKGLKCLKW